MVEVFKTNIVSKSKAKETLQMLKSKFPNYKITCPPVYPIFLNYLSFCPYVHILFPNYISVHLSISIYLSIFLPNCLSFHLFFHTIHLSVYLLPNYPFSSLSVHLSIITIYLSICLFVCTEVLLIDTFTYKSFNNNKIGQQIKKILLIPTNYIH